MPRVSRRHSRRLESPKARRRKSRPDRSVQHRAVPLANHRPAPRLRRRSQMRMPETGEPVAWSSTTHRVMGFRGKPHDATPKTCAPKGAISKRPPSPASAVGPVVADPSPASGPGLPLAGALLREARKTPVGSARFRRAWRHLPWAERRFGKAYRLAIRPIRYTDARDAPYALAFRRFGKAYRLAIRPIRYTDARDAPYALAFNQHY